MAANPMTKARMSVLPANPVVGIANRHATRAPAAKARSRRAYEGDAPPMLAKATPPSTAMVSPTT